MSYPMTSTNKKMRCIPPLISLLRSVPAMSVELFRIVSAIGLGQSDHASNENDLEQLAPLPKRSRQPRTRR
jgi:hypothetical protein